MNRLLSILVPLLFLVVVGTDPLFAQVRRPLPNRRPAVSPYLDLLERPGGSSFGFQYLRRVRPELEFRSTQEAFRQSIGTLNREVQQQQRELQQSETSGLEPTGHQTMFMNHSKYFGVGQNAGSTSGRSYRPR